MSHVSVTALRAALSGRVIGRDDQEYDAARRVFAGDIDRRPLAICRPWSAEDVARIIMLARDANVPLAVRSGGHGIHGVVSDGIVIDLRGMKSLEVDHKSRSAWAETGLTAGEYSSRVGEFGLATGFGDTGSVGIGGITLGGGVGYLVRKHGLTIDSVLAAEIVTADGVTRVVHAHNEPDLFWAIRGGGGNFGVVTRFHYRLHPVDRIVGGMLLLPATRDVIAGVIDACEAAPDELSVIANVMTAPPLPFVPATHHGSLVVMLLTCYAGESDAGTNAHAPFRALAHPIADLVRPMRYPELFPPDDGSYHPTAVGRTMFVDRVDRGVAETILEYLRDSDASLRVAQLRVLGGAMSRVAPDATAFAHRQSRIMVNVAAFYEGASDRPRREAWVTQFAAALRQNDGGAYVSFLGDEGEARIRAAYPGSTWDRLTAIKAQYDPDNVFRQNQNIQPAAMATGAR